MTDETTPAAESATDTAGEEAAFAAAFSEARGVDDATPPAATAEAVVADAAQVEMPAQPAEPTDDIIPQLGLKGSEVRAMLARVGEVDGLKRQLEEQTARIFGKFGEVQREVKSLKAGPETRATQAAAGRAAAKLNKLRAEYPEIAELLEGDLADAVRGTPDQQFDPSTIDRIVTERMQAQEVKTRAELGGAVLDVAHPGWKDEVKTNEFKSWLSLINPDVAQRFRSSYDPSFVSEGLSNYRQWKAQRSVPQSASPKTDNAQKQQSRLQRAIPATHGSPSIARALSEQEAFEAAFKSARS